MTARQETNRLHGDAIFRMSVVTDLSAQYDLRSCEMRVEIRIDADHMRLIIESFNLSDLAVAATYLTSYHWSLW